MKIVAPKISQGLDLGRYSSGLVIALLVCGLWACTFSATVNAQSCTIDQTSTRTGTRIVIDLQSGCTSDAQTTFGAATLYWADYLYSQVPILVEADFQPLSCNATQGTLGSAGPNTFAVNFSGAAASNIYYPIALANSLRGVDLVPASADISMAYNNNIGNPGCLESASWFYDDGTSTSAPANTFDLYGVIQHELGHGLGVISLYRQSGIFGSDDPSDPFAGFTDSYSQYLYSETFAQEIDTLSTANRASTFTSESGLTWSGAAVDSLSGTLTAGTTNNNVRMYAPSTYSGGSSVSHFDTAVEPTDLMEPIKVARSLTNFNLTRNLLRDVGWQTLPDPPAISATETSPTSLTFAVTAPSQTGGSTILNYTVTCGNVSETSASSTITVSGLLAGTVYSCSGVATTGIGSSDASATVTATTDLGGPPEAPILSSVVTEQTSESAASATVTFSPAPTGLEPNSYVATCTPQSATRQLSSQVRLSGDVPTAKEFAALSSNPSKAETDALRQLHQSETFRDSGARCGTDAINSRNSNVPRTLADCTNSLTVIKSAYETPTNDTYVIPIVWHVIYKSDIDQTGLLSPEDIADQIDALNEDFAGFFGAGVDTKIQFVLENTNYYQNDTAYDDTTSAAYDLKDQNKVDGTRFLNVFSNDAQGNLGYAWFPAWGVGTSDDFITMNAAYVGGRSNGAGVFDEGRTLVHEIGHYLGLIHTFGDDATCDGNTYSSGDLIVDTPEQKFSDYSQASSDCGVTSALNNFMNYSYDDLMHTFTEEQTNRMICSLQNYRSTGYELVSDGPTAVTATGTTSPVVVPDLVAGTTYQCSVVALAGTQQSASSSSGSIVAGDRDGDGVLDYDDAFPNDPTETTDSDGEGLGDNLEGTLGTDINNPDTDGDGYTDYEEYVDGTDPLDDGDPGSGGLPIWLLYQATQ